MKIVSGRFAEHIGKKLSRKPYDWDILFTGKNKDGRRYFPDGEPYFSLPDEKKLKNEHVMILTSGHPKPTVGLLELEELVKIAEDNKASKVDLFFLYFPFGMQDKKFRSGERNIAKDICDKFKDYKMYVIDAHFKGKKWVRKYDIKYVSTEFSMARELDELGYKDYIPVACDVGEARRSGIEGFYKERIDSDTVIIKATPELIKKIKGKPIKLKDDIIETGGTAIGCYVAAREHASDVIFSATHGVLPFGVRAVREAFKGKVYFTNTINGRGANIDIIPVVNDVLLHMK